MLYNDGQWYRCQVADINGGAGPVGVELGTGMKVSLKKHCAHLVFSQLEEEGGKVDDDVVHFDLAKYGHTLAYSNKSNSYAWAYSSSEL